MKRRLKKKYKDGIIGFLNIFVTGLLWLITSIPIVTMGAASCASFHVMAHSIGKERNVIGTYFASFKQNFMLTLPMQLCLMAMGALLGIDIYYLHGYGTSATKTLMVLSIMVAAILVMFIMYLYPFVQKFDAKRSKLVKISLYALVRYLYVSFIMLALFVIAVMSIYYVHWLIILVPGPVIYTKAFFLKRVLARFVIGANAEGEEEDLAEASRIIKRQAKKLGKERDYSEYYEDEDEEPVDRIIRKQ